MVITDVNQVVYQGDGATTAFPFTFRIIDATDVKLLLIDADGTETNITSDYFVDINTNTVHYPGYAPGSEPAEADQPAPVQTGQKLMIYRKLPITQEKDLGDKWPFYVIELGLDKLTMILQDIWDWCGRCLQVSRGQAADAGDDFDPTIPLEAGKVVIGNDAGTGFSSAKALLYENDGWNAEGQSISNVATPGKVKDATTKEYVDNLIDKLSVEADRYVVFDNVAAMKAADLPAGYNTRTLGYHDINDGGAGVYSIRGKVAGETEDGGSVLFLENGNVAELIVTGEVNINQFGGVGDGTTDDSTAIVNAVAYASKKNCRLVFLEGYTYYSSQPIVIANPPDEIRMDGTLKYTGSGTALTIGAESVIQMRKKITLKVDGSTHTAGSKGVVLYNLNSSQINLVSVQNFGDTAIEYCGNKAGFAYNSTFVGYVYSTPVGLKLTNKGGGWCNENKFFGGRFGTNSSDSFEATDIGVLITSDDENYYQNNNIFYSPSLEIAYGVKIEFGGCNKFYDCRTEGATIPLTVVQKLSNSYNSMYSTYGVSGYYSSNANISDGTNLYIDRYTTLRSFFTETIFDSGNISDNVATNGTTTSFKKLLSCYKGTVYKTLSSNYCSVNDGVFTITNANGIVGALVDTVKNKAFLVDCITSVNCRINVFMWDADGNLINDSAPTYTRATNAGARGYLALQGSGAGGGQYSYALGADTIPTIIIGLPTKCVRAFIGITKAQLSVYNFKLKARYNETAHYLENIDGAVLPSVPTSVGKVGQFVKKTTPTQGEIGWVYDGTQWLTVG